MRIYRSAIGATQDRRTVSRGAKGKLKADEMYYYSILQSKSGPSVHNPYKVIRNWRKAFKNEMQKNKMIEELQRPFRHRSLINELFCSIFSK